MRTCCLNYDSTNITRLNQLKQLLAESEYEYSIAFKNTQGVNQLLSKSNPIISKEVWKKKLSKSVVTWRLYVHAIPISTVR